MQWCVSDLKIITFFNITALFALCELECKTLCFILVITRAVTQISAVHTSLTRSTHAKLCDQTDLAVRRSTRRQSADFFYQLQKYFNWIAPISYSLVERWSQANSSRGSWDVHAKICVRTHPLVPWPREIDVYFSREGVVFSWLCYVTSELHALLRKDGSTEAVFVNVFNIAWHFRNYFL